MGEIGGMPVTDAERRAFFLEVLDDARFEGPDLHEPLWVLNVRYPSATQAEREEFAEATLLALLDQRLIELFEPGSDLPLSTEHARAVILGSAWRTVPVQEIYEVASTSAGDEAHEAVPAATWDAIFTRRPDRRQQAEAQPERTM
jgi:hypothetical protein